MICNKYTFVFRHVDKKKMMTNDYSGFCLYNRQVVMHFSIIYRSFNLRKNRNYFISVDYFLTKSEKVCFKG